MDVSAFHIRFQRAGSGGSACPKQIVPAGVAQLRQCVVFGKKSKDWFSLSPFSGKSSIESGGLLIYTETLSFEEIRQIAGRQGFLVSSFRMPEDIAGGLDQFLLVGGNPAGDDIFRGWSGSYMIIGMHVFQASLPVFG